MMSYNEQYSKLKFFSPRMIVSKICVAYLKNQMTMSSEIKMHENIGQRLGLQIVFGGRPDRSSKNIKDFFQ